MHRAQYRFAALLLGFGLALSSAAALAEPSAADRETARALVIDGRAKMGAGDYRAALKAFEAAHAIMHVPTTGLDLAKAQEALGMLIEARTSALEVTRMPPESGEPAAFTNARAEAVQFAEKLAARIPSVVITVKGLPQGIEGSVTIDGDAIPGAALSLPRKTNPGTHEVVAAAAEYTTEKRSITLKEGETMPLEIKLAEAKPQVSVPPPPTMMPRQQEPTKPTVLPPAPSPQEAPREAIPMWAWGAGAVGVLSLGASAVFAVDYFAVRDKVASECPSNTCDPKLYGGVDDMQAVRQRWNRDLGLFIGLGALGAAGIGAAVVGIVKAPRDERRATPAMAVTPLLGPGGGGALVEGIF